MKVVTQGYGANQRVIGQGYGSTPVVVATAPARIFVARSRALVFIAPDESLR
jgi:hypothetical protein